ncbi:DUF3107 domain-containing protein [Vallicoccus soli]|uniref:DUF3107 domain-containing protein n=1 Tax=Vallicoccus soli TaxID=2339232 RepID=A0A3A3Z834_9ACTN|nr:DUF3107 domain-containing protein [Vallicoccus soli]RJK98067.1 DUF3107 domain-containing protein [Vallicoccus soli]
MEVKIGVQNAAREVVLESAETAQQVAEAVSAALSSGTGLIDLVDEKGRRVLVPVDKVAYVEIGEPEARRVGFGAM